jgi:plasmid stability protein
MGQVLVRNLENDVIESLKLKADLKGHSLEQELREVLRAAAQFTAEERVALSARIRASQTKPTDLLSEDLIREARDNR